VQRAVFLLLLTCFAQDVLAAIQVGSGPSFSYRYSPREAMAADPNAAYTNAGYSREGPANLNCSYFSPRSSTNLSSGTVTYAFEAPPGFVIEHAAFTQKGSLFAPGAVWGDQSADHGAWQRFFSLRPYASSPFSYERQANLRGVYATNIAIRYTLVLTNGFNYNVQLLRDCDDARTAFLANGTVLTRAEANRRLTLVPARAAWKYLDTGTDPGSAWRLRGFNDSTWRSGIAEFGYGDDDEATRISFGANAGDKFVTTYFRHEFRVTNAPAFQRLSLGLLVDDGAVVYLNGFEVSRVNMTGPVGHRIYAEVALIEPEEMTFRDIGIDPETLADGTNVLAVEVHQATADSSDLSFDLDLRATVAQPQLYARRQAGCVMLSWFVPGFILEGAPDLHGPWSEIPTGPAQTHSACDPSQRAFYRLRYKP
jgi:hypothetical protein